MSARLCEQVGRLAGLEVGVEAVDAVTASVDLAVAGLFIHEAAVAALAGGMLHLDRALNHAVTRLRAEGVFSGAVGSTLLIRQPPASIMAGAVLILGLGDPQRFEPSVLRAATRRAYDTAVLLGARSVVFAPSVLDGGVRPSGDQDLSRAMIQGLAEGLSAADSLASRLLAPPSSVACFRFAASPAHFAGAAQAFREAIKRLA